MSIGRIVACIVGILYTIAGLYYACVSNPGMAVIYLSYACSMVGLFIVG